MPSTPTNPTKIPNAALAVGTITRGAGFIAAQHNVHRHFTTTLNLISVNGTITKVVIVCASKTNKQKKERVMKKVHTFTVFGTGFFPSDMLRYDRAYAASTDEQCLIDEHTISEERSFYEIARSPLFRLSYSVRLAAPNAPTTARWESFGWKVSDPIVR